MHKYASFEVSKRMLQIISAEGSMQCIDIIGRICEVIRLAKDMDDPIATLQQWGLVFNNTHFYVHRRIVSSLLLVPESVLTRRFDQEGMVVQKDPALRDALGPRQDWEARVYSPRSNCKKLLNMIGRSGVFLSCTTRKKHLGSDDLVSGNYECRLDCFTRPKLPEKLIVYGPQIEERKSDGGFAVLVADGGKMTVFGPSPLDEAKFPMVALPVETSVWVGKE